MIVILTALQREHKAVRKYLTGLRTHHHVAGTVFEVGVLAGHPDRQVALAVIGQGNASAASITERAINEFEPAAVMFIGIAGGLRDWLELGDVVVATRVYGYHGGTSEDNGFRARPRAWDASHRLEQVARLVDSADTWRSTTGTDSSVHFGPIAAGEVLLNSTRSELATLLHEHYNDAIAIEMESAGVANASHLNLATPTITIRGISDLANGRKELTDRTPAPQLAANNAAAFAMAFIARLEDAGSPPNRHPEGKAPKYGGINNTASGDAGVVAQIGVVHGDVRFGQPDKGSS
jgi:adenosylhomocysteine nucleosidase